ncbi:hypothetical protein TWF225_011187 [Orbilia oligospora]|nr:hypothetical protein TWF225_011187 [Orbilia oligospora]
MKQELTCNEQQMKQRSTDQDDDFEQFQDDGEAVKGAVDVQWNKRRLSERGSTEGQLGGWVAVDDSEGACDGVGEEKRKGGEEALRVVDGMPLYPSLLSSCQQSARATELLTLLLTLFLTHRYIYKIQADFRRAKEMSPRLTVVVARF